jgi:heme A synthase
MTLLDSLGSVPVFYGVMHQAVAIFIFGIGLLNLYLFKRRRSVV